MANFWRLCIRLKRSMACSRRRNGRCEFSARLFSQRPVHSLTIGVGVVEHEPEGKAAAEIRKLLTWVWEQLAQ